MPVPRETEVPFRENSKQVAFGGLLAAGSIFKGYQKSKGNSYEVEVVLQVNINSNKIRIILRKMFQYFSILLNWCKTKGFCKIFLGFCEVSEYSMRISKLTQIFRESRLEVARKKTNFVRCANLLTWDYWVTHLA